MGMFGLIIGYVQEIGLNKSAKEDADGEKSPHEHYKNADYP